MDKVYNLPPFIVLILVISVLVATFSCAPSELTTKTDTITSETTSPGMKPPPSTWMETDPLLTEAVVNGDLIVLGTITNEKYEDVTIESGDNSIQKHLTLFTLAIEKVVKGNPDTKEITIGVEGGWINEEVFLVPTGSYFTIGDQIFACVYGEEGGYYTFKAPLGVFWKKRSDGYEYIITKQATGERMTLERWIGEIIIIMQANNIPIALPKDEIPPLPFSTTFPGSK